MSVPLKVTPAVVGKVLLVQEWAVEWQDLFHQGLCNLEVELILTDNKTAMKRTCLLRYLR